VCGATSLVGFEGYAVRESSAGVVVIGPVTNQATTDTTFMIGVLTQGSVVGEPVEVIQAGIVTCVAGTGGVTAGARIKPEYSGTAANNGRFIASTAELAGDFTYGTALTAASANGQFDALILPQYHIGTTSP
jgi:hypothetical protein